MLGVDFSVAEVNYINLFKNITTKTRKNRLKFKKSTILLYMIFFSLQNRNKHKKKDFCSSCFLSLYIENIEK